MTGTAAIVASLLIFFFLSVNGKLETTSFNFSSFRSVPESISFLGHGVALNDSLELNNNSNDSYGRAFYTEPVRLWENKTGNVASFSTHFSFSVFREPSQNGYPDGMVFFLAPLEYEVRNDSGGSRFTVFDEKKNVSVVAVEFDTSLHEKVDPIDTHVGINVGSAISETRSLWNPFSGRSNITVNAYIAYNATSKNLTASFVDDKGDTKVLYYVFDLRGVLPEKVTIGFAATTRAYERYAVDSWSFSSSIELPEDIRLPPYTDPSPRRKIITLAAVAGGLAGLLAVAITATVCVWFFVRRRTGCVTYGGRCDMRTHEKERNGESGPRSFSYRELARATKNFAPEESLGRGGFGFVYKGCLKKPEMTVAIKRVSRDSQQGKKEYDAEVKIVSRVQHKNIVKLLGWCHGRAELLLVYEFMPNGSLDTHLYGGGEPLPWLTRYNIAKGVAAALLYLHEEGGQCVVHRDVKSSNVMLDADFNAKLGDFGLARVMDRENVMKTTAIAGTRGYLAPEIETTKASSKSDVYSFGVLALEIACGRRPIELTANRGGACLVDWVLDCYKKGFVLEAADPRLGEAYDESEMEKLMVVGLWCAHPSYQDRPSMSQVIGILCFDMPLPSLLPQWLGSQESVYV